jgi:hypothetical protein
MLKIELYLYFFLPKKFNDSRGDFRDSYKAGKEVGIIWSRFWYMDLMDKSYFANAAVKQR